MNFLYEPLLTGAALNGSKSRYSLPGALAALIRGDIIGFASLRSHQRHIWHAFIVQLAALALEKAKENCLPDDEETWQRVLRGLTLGWPEGEPWSLAVADLSKPAFLQAPIAGGIMPKFKSIETPDALDILITSKNHDLKSARMYNAAPEDWLFALVSLQTQQGVMGAGKYGISRMNGGFGARSLFGVDSTGQAGSRFRRDVTRLLTLSEDEANPLGLSRDGTALLWLEPWDGSSQLDFRNLHPSYIEICRRVRLGLSEGTLFAMDAPSRAPRIGNTEQLKGDTGDPWTPVSTEGKAFTVSGEGFSCRKLSELFNPEKYRLPIATHFLPSDAIGGASLVAQSVCRGQGKTQGYHERRIYIPPEAVALCKEDRDTFVEIIDRRARALSELRLALRLALAALCQRISGSPISDRETRFIEPVLERFDALSDRDFYSCLWNEIGATKEERPAIYKSWLRSEARRAQKLLEGTPDMLGYRPSWRSWVSALSEPVFRAVIARSTSLKPIMENTNRREQASADF